MVSQQISKQRVKPLPRHSHQLSSNDGVAAVSADTKVKLYVDLCIVRDIADTQNSLVKVCGDDLVIKNKLNVVVRSSLFYQALIE